MLAANNNNNNNEDAATLKPSGEIPALLCQNKVYYVSKLIKRNRMVSRFRHRLEMFNA